MTHYYVKKEKLSHGFKVGINNITITKIQKWRIGKVQDFRVHDLDDFITHLQNNTLTIVDWDNAWFQVQLSTLDDVERLYQSTLSYQNKG